MHFCIQLSPAVLLNLEKESESSGVSPKLAGTSLRCAFPVSNLMVFLSPFMILWPPSEVRLSGQLQTFSP